MPPQRQSAKKEQVNGSIFIHITKTGNFPLRFGLFLGFNPPWNKWPGDPVFDQKRVFQVTC